MYRRISETSRLGTFDRDVVVGVRFWLMSDETQKPKTPSPVAPRTITKGSVVLSCVVFACCHHIPAGHYSACQRRVALDGPGLIGVETAAPPRDQDKIPELQQLLAA